jgi:hypothetical protein
MIMPASMGAAAGCIAEVRGEEAPLPETKIPRDWVRPDFDASHWWRSRGPIFSGSTKYYGPNGWGIWLADGISALCLRRSFTVISPAAAQDLTLSVEYRGGLVVDLNGKEIARRHLPTGAEG